MAIPFDSLQKDILSEQKYIFFDEYNEWTNNITCILT